MHKKYFQFIKFSMVGAINTITSLLIYYVMIYFNVNYMISIIVSYVLSSTIGYILNKYFVFHDRAGGTKKSILKYYIVYGSALLLNITLMYILVDLLSVPKVISPVIVLCFIIPYNFILSKHWTFRNN